MGDSTELEILVLGRDEASGVLGRVGGALGQLGSSATRLGSDLLPLSAASAVVAGSALAMAADYEQSMNILQEQSGATVEQMAALDEQAIALGADMTLPGTSAADAAEAMLELSKAGLSVTATMDAAQGVLQMSAAGQLENAEAAAITANALNMFGLAGSDASMVADLLAAAANASSADVRGMADSLQMVGSVAAMTGQSIGDTTTAIALMANAGISGSDAGTSLKQMLLSLASPTNAAAELMSTLGINIYDANGALLPMPELIDQFGGALDGLSQQQRNAALATIFGSDAVRSANTVLLGGREAWDQMSTAVNQAGAAQDLAAAQTTGFKGALDGLRSTVETVLMEGARPLLAILTPLVRGFADLIGQVTAANPQLVTAGLAFAGVLAVAAPVALGVGWIATALGALMAPVGLVIIGVGLLAAAWATNFGGIRETTEAVFAAVGPVLQTMLPAALASLQTAWTTVWGTIQSYVSVVIGLVLPLIESFVSGAVGVFTTVWPQILATVSGVLNGVWAVVQQVLGVVLMFVATHGDEIRAFITTAWTAIKEIIQTALAIIQGTITPVLQAIAGFIRTHGTEIQAVLDAAWAAIKGIVEGALKLIQGILKAVLQAIHGDWKGAWETLKETGASVWETIKETVARIAEKIGPILATIWEGIKAKAEAAWENVKTAAAAKWEAVKAAIVQKINDALAAVLKWLDDTLVRIEGFDLKAAAAKFFATAIAGIALKISEAITAVGTWLADVAKKISGFSLKSSSETTFGTVVSGLAAKVVEILRNVGVFLIDIRNKIAGYTFKSDTMTAIQTVVLGIIEKAVDIIREVMLFLVRIRTSISGFSLADAGRALIQGMIDGVTAMAGALLAAATGVVSSAVQAAKNLLGIKSPSTVFAEMGRQIIEGLIEGMDEEKAAAAAKVAEAMATIVQAAVDAAQALQDFKPVEDLGVITGQVLDFLLGVETQFQALVALVDQKLADQAAALAEALGKVVGVFGEALAFIGELRDLIAGGAVITNSESLPQPLIFLKSVLRRLAELVQELMVDPLLANLDDEFVAFNERLSSVVGPFAEALAFIGELRDLIAGGAVITNSESLPQPLIFLKNVLGRMAELLSDLTADPRVAGLDDELVAFAGRLEGITGVWGGAMEAVSALAEFVVLPDITALDPALNQLREFLQRIVIQLSIAGQIVGEELQAAAKSFAETAGPVVKIVEDGVKAFFELAKWTGLADAQAGLEGLPTFIGDLVTKMGEASELISGELQTAARDFAELAKPVMDTVVQGVKSLTDFAELQAKLGNPKKASLPAIELLDAGIDFIRQMVQKVADLGMQLPSGVLADARFIADMVSGVMKVIGDAIKALAEYSEIDLSDLAPSGYTAGVSWITALADGISSGMSYLEAALQSVANLFPHSPAKDGPLRQMPDWNAWMLPGLDAAAATVGQRLSGIGGQVGVGAVAAVATPRSPGSGNAGGQEVHIHMHDAVIREELDIERLADAIGQVLAGKALTNRRLATVW